jgi:cholesterol oxidase
MSVSFTEVMTGSVGHDRLELRLTLTVDDFDAFVADAKHRARVTGWICCAALGGRLPVEEGTCAFFPANGRALSEAMRYRLTFRDGDGRRLTLNGVKRLRAWRPLGIWPDTTTLYIRLIRDPEATESASGVVRIRPLAFLKQLTTFHGEGASVAVRAQAVGRFVGFFVRGLWRGYLRPAARASEGRTA